MRRLVLWVLAGVGSVLLGSSIVVESLRDAFRRMRFFAHPHHQKNRIQGQAQLQKDVHLLERALSLPEPRRPFGAVVTQRILQTIEDFGAVVPPELLAQAHRALEDRSQWNEHGIRPRPVGTKPEREGETILSTRRSVRSFVEGEVPTAQELEKIIELAAWAPSVSNTQSWRVRQYRDPGKQDELLAHQDGHVGIDVIPLLLLVSSDIRSFVGPHERNQMWIDGGIFLQQLLLAIESQGFASCPMNFSATNAQANRLRKAASIPAYEEIICFVALGRPSGINPADSPRLRPDNFLLD
ncbi:MAG: nitroreductase family protein [Microbacteriaceae bacterium]